MIRYRSRWLKYGELWFDQSCPFDEIDVIYHHRASTPVAGAANEEFYTLVVNLRQSEQEIIAGFHRNTRSKIKRAEAEDGLRYEVMDKPTAATVSEFIAFYDKFARSKGVTPVRRDHLEHHLSAGALVLSRVSSDDQTLVWHSFLRLGPRATLTHSGSLYRGHEKNFQTLVGRANRLHHLKDMLFFKNNGCDIYDFGGWYAGAVDEERLRINHFKEEFGGKKIRQFNVVQYRTWRAKLLKSFRRLLSSG